MVSKTARTGTESRTDIDGDGAPVRTYIGHTDDDKTKKTLFSKTAEDRRLCDVRLRKLRSAYYVGGGEETVGGTPITFPLRRYRNGRAVNIICDGLR